MTDRTKSFTHSTQLRLTNKLVDKNFKSYQPKEFFFHQNGYSLSSPTSLLLIFFLCSTDPHAHLLASDYGLDPLLTFLHTANPLGEVQHSSKPTDSSPNYLHSIGKLVLDFTRGKENN